MTGAERRAVAALAALSSVRLLGLFMLLPVLALYADALPGATPLRVGLAVGAYGITQALLQIPFGAASDRFGRKGVLVLGLAVFAAGGAMAALADHVLWVIAGRVVQGAGAISAVVTALLADLTREAVRTRAMAIMGASIGASFLFSLMLGPVLAARLGVDGLFWITCALALAALAGVLAWRPPPRGAPAPRGRWRDVLANRPLHRLTAGIFTLHLIVAALFVALPFVLRDEAGLAPERHWTVYLAAVAASIVLTIVLIRAAERARRPAAVTVAALMLLAGGLIALTVTPARPGPLWLALTAFFGGFNFLEARLPAEVSVAAGAGQRGAALGVYASAQYLGVFAGGALGGAFLGAAGARGVLALCAAAAVLWWLTGTRLFVRAAAR